MVCAEEPRTRQSVDQEETHKVGCGEVVAGIALCRGVLGVVVVLLGCALDRAAQQATPHGEVDGGHTQAGHSADCAAHPLERVELLQGCGTHGTLSFHMPRG